SGPSRPRGRTWRPCRSGRAGPGVAGSDELRMNPQLGLAEGPVFEPEPRAVTEAVLDDVAAVLAFEVADSADDITGDHLGVLPLRVSQRGRGDPLAHGVDAIGVTVATAARPSRSEHVVRAPAH